MTSTLTLRCNQCAREFGSADGYVLSCCDGGLLEGRYPRRLEVHVAAGLWRFLPWLPVSRAGRTEMGSVTLQVPALGEAMGLPNLWLSFSGYWPEQRALCPTGSFKDLEVGPTLQRLLECDAPGVVVATAGNTGRSFAHLGGQIGFPTVVVVAEQHASRIWRPGAAQAPTTTVVALRDADYGDAKEIATEIANALGWPVEGGVHNVARRDGIGTLLLDAVTEMGRLPDHYVQAVGGGPGPIGVGDMADRLVADGRFGPRPPRVHLIQNLEHQPVNRAWRAGRDHLLPDDFPAGPVETFADVLVNRAPAYGIHGGLHDLLARTGGQTYAVSRALARDAQERFERIVGIDILEPAAVAVAGLELAVRDEEVDPSDHILLAVTGGGVERLRRDVPLVAPTPVVTDRDSAVSIVAELTEARA
jgi:cysteate synthase